MKPTPPAESYEQTLSGPERTQLFYATWLLGLLAPAIASAYGVICIIRQTGTLPGRSSSQNLVLHGFNAVALGMASLAVGLFLHCAFYWGSKYDGIWFAEIGKIIAGIVFIGAAATLIVRVGVYGIA